MRTITYKANDGLWDRGITLPSSHRNWIRDKGDIILVKVIAIDCPLRVFIQIKTNGSITLAKVDWSFDNNTYWHTYTDNENQATEAQEKTIALIFSGDAITDPDLVCDPLIPREILRGLGATPQKLLKNGVMKTLENLGKERPYLA